MNFKINIAKLYFGLVSFVSILILAFSLSSLISSILKYMLISDEEYIASKYYELNTCKYEKQISIASSNQQTTQKSPEEIAKCIAETRKKLLNQRKYQLKTNIIENLSYSFIFFVIFSIHFYHFRKLTE